MGKWFFLAIYVKGLKDDSERILDEINLDCKDQKIIIVLVDCCAGSFFPELYKGVL